MSQTEPNLELIIVDDGSTDSSGETICHYAKRDDRITHVRQQNLGLPKALNNGFRLARGEYFTWTSDDNRYFADALAVMSRHLRDDPEIGLVHAVVPGANLDHAVNEYVNEIFAAGPEAVAAAKALIPQVYGRTGPEIRSLTAAAIAARRVSAEGRRGSEPSWRSGCLPGTTDTISSS